MKTLKEIIPLKIKSPIAVFLREYRKYPLRLVWGHMLRTYIEEGGTVTAAKQKRIYQFVHRVTIDYLSARYEHVISENVKEYHPGIKPEKQVIWIFWWQGENQAPDIVKRCIASIRRNTQSMHICVIDAKNYQEYVSVPAHIVKKLDEGSISFTHFSDYYRMALLAAHGGIWLDASIYLKNQLPREILDKPIYTVRNPGGDITNVSNWEWTVSAIAGWQGNTLFCKIEKLLSEYWKTNDNLVDYFLFDYMVRLVVSRCKGLYSEICNIPVSNPSFMYLQDHFGDSADAYMSEFCSLETFLYKLSWKGIYPNVTKDGKETLYSWWMSENPYDC